MDTLFDTKEVFAPKKLSPFIKWPGGKTGELAKIKAAAPRSISRFIEPFLGGGSVLLSIHPDIPVIGNDVIPELVDLYLSGSGKNSDVKKNLENHAAIWNHLNNLRPNYERMAANFSAKDLDFNFEISEILKATKQAFKKADVPNQVEFEKRLTKDLPQKILRISALQEKHSRKLPQDELEQNIEGAVRAAYYMSIRSRYNTARVGGIFNAQRSADFFFIREYCYASMFRFNSADEFNVPYGGVSYNKKDFSVKVNSLFSTEMAKRLSNAEFTVLDFFEFISKVKPNSEDFIFVDPPYDSDFNDYDNRDFLDSDQARLAKVLENLTAKVMIVIGDTPLIRSLYTNSHWNIQTEDMFYKWTVKSRNTRETKHLTITNY
jgi:DNA adenine methylase